MLRRHAIRRKSGQIGAKNRILPSFNIVQLRSEIDEIHEFERIIDKLDPQPKDNIPKPILVNFKVKSKITQ